MTYQSAYHCPHRQPRQLRWPRSHRSLHTDSQSAYLRNPKKATSAFFERKNRYSVFLFEESHLTFDIVHTKVSSRSNSKSWVCFGTPSAVSKRPAKKMEYNNDCSGPKWASSSFLWLEKKEVKGERHLWILMQSCFCIFDLMGKKRMEDEPTDNIRFILAPSIVADRSSTYKNVSLTWCQSACTTTFYDWIPDNFSGDFDIQKLN